MPTNGALARRANKARRERDKEREKNPLRPYRVVSAEPSYSDELAKEFHKDSRKVEAAKRQLPNVEEGSDLYLFLKAVIGGDQVDSKVDQELTEEEQFELELAAAES